VNKADGDRLYPLINELLDRARDIGLGQRPLHLAFGVDAFVDLDAQMALDEGRRLGPRQVIEPRHPQGADLEHVAEAFCRDQPGPRALQFEDRVRCNRGAVQHLDDFGVIEPALADQLGQPVDAGQ
jgi:hypothetical protein